MHVRWEFLKLRDNRQDSERGVGGEWDMPSDPVLREGQGLPLPSESHLHVLDL